MASQTYPGLHPSIQSRQLHVGDLSMHIFECMPSDSPTDANAESLPLVLLLHGFPELAYSWRHLLEPLARKGFHVVAPDLRGYGRTVPFASNKGEAVSELKPISFEDDLSQFAMPNLVGDVVKLIHALGYTAAHTVIGHDFGSILAGLFALTNPTLLRALVLMSAPFPGIPSDPSSAFPPTDLDEALAKLDPPKKHYTAYLSTPNANMDMCSTPSMQDFLRTYFHCKSASAPVNRDPIPHALSSRSSEAVKVLPAYYIMPLESSMPSAIAPYAQEEERSSTWMDEDSLGVYAREFGRTGLQGALNWYRALRSPELTGPSLPGLAGKQIPATVSALYVSGRMDWGVYQGYGALDAMRHTCVGMKEGDEGVILVDEAGHWVQQEAPEAVLKVIGDFLDGIQV